MDEDIKDPWRDLKQWWAYRYKQLWEDYDKGGFRELLDDVANMHGIKSSSVRRQLNRLNPELFEGQEMRSGKRTDWVKTLWDLGGEKMGVYYKLPWESGIVRASFTNVHDALNYAYSFSVPYIVRISLEILEYEDGRKEKIYTVWIVGSESELEAMGII